MPEIAEVARIVGRLKTHLVGRTIVSVSAVDDNKVFHQTTATAFESAMRERTVKDVKQWGKYFWLVMDKSPHPLMHFGMSGWIHIKSDPSAHYRSPESPSATQTWPPKSEKFRFTLEDNNEVSFADMRRLGRVRLVDYTDGSELRSISPLAENGPDPVLDPPSPEWLKSKLKFKRVPIKAWLLDQKNLAGIGNWVGDEVLYNARLHPESYTNNLDEKTVERLHQSILDVCKIAVEADAESHRFPKDWLMLHRWGKGKKVNKLPSGETIQFVTVGGRTSAFVPSLQKKVGPEAEDAGSAKKGSKKGSKSVVEKEEEEEQNVKPTALPQSRRKRKAKDEFEEEMEGEQDVQKSKAGKKSKTRGIVERVAETSGLRRSGRGKSEA